MKKIKNQSKNITKILTIISELKIPFILTTCNKKDASIIYNENEISISFSRQSIKSEENYTDIFKSLLIENNIKSIDLINIKKRVLRVLRDLTVEEEDYFIDDLMFAYIPEHGFYWHQFKVGREYSTILTSKDVNEADGWARF